MAEAIAEQQKSSTFASLSLLTSMLSTFEAQGGAIEDVGADLCSSKISAQFWSTKAANFDVSILTEVAMMITTDWGQLAQLLNPSVPDAPNWRISTFEKRLHETETSKNVVGGV